VRAAQGLFRAGSRGAQAVERFAETGSVAATFRADEASRQAAATSGAAASPAASSAAENAATAGGPAAAQAYLRGTSEGFPGSPGLQKIGITPASTDPVVATVFATEAESFGRGVVHIATPADLAGVTVSQGSVRAALEAEVAVELLPAEFAARASTTITAAEARTALSNLGVRVPPAIRGSAAADSVLRNTPRLTDAQIKEFLDAVKGTPR